MTALNFSDLSKEIEEKLNKEESIVLATSANDETTARLMAHINYGPNVLFSTSRNSKKVKQIELNSRIALAINNIKIEAKAELFGHPSEHPTFLKDYAAKFPFYAKLYQSNPEDILIIAEPIRISLYKYAGKPCEDVLLPQEEKAYRMELN